MEGAQGGDGVGRRGRLVRAVAPDAREAQRHPACVAGAGLDAVAGDFHHLLRAHVYHRPPAVGLQAQEPLRLPAQQLVAQALEGLADRREPAAFGVARRQVQVAQVPAAAARAPLHRHHHQVEGMGRLDLEPTRAPPPRGVGAGERLEHHSLVAGGPGLRGVALGLLGIGGGQPRHAQRRGTGRIQRFQPFAQGTVRQVGAVQMQAIEEEGAEGQSRGAARRRLPAAEAAHGDLERMRLAVAAQRNHLAVQNHAVQRQPRRRGRDFRQVGGQLAQIARVDLDPRAGAVDLDPRAVILGLHRGRTGAPQRAGDVGRGLGQHRQQRAEQREPEPGERSLAAAKQRAAHRRQ